MCLNLMVFNGNFQNGAHLFGCNFNSQSIALIKYWSLVQNNNNNSKLIVEYIEINPIRV